MILEGNKELCKHSDCYHDNFTEVRRGNGTGFTEVEYKCINCDAIGNWISCDSENINWDDPCDYE